MAHVSQEKKEVIKKLNKLIQDYPIIGCVNMENLPAPQLQNMRAQLRDKVVVFMTKKRLMKIAFESSKGDKKGIEELGKYFRGMPALLFTKDNPFTLFKILKKNKSSAPAKAGQTAPNDIIVKAGKTNFAPGPVIGELGALGIKTEVQDGKIAIKEDSVVCKEGEEIGGNLAAMLTRLGIEPMEVGLDLVATYEEGTIFTKDILDIDEEEFMNKLSSSINHAINLAIEAGFPTKETTELMLNKAARESRGLAIEIGFLSKDVIDALISKAEAQMNALKTQTGQ